MPTFLTNPQTWGFIALLLQSLQAFFPHATQLAPTAAAMANAAAAGDVNGAIGIGASAGTAALVGLVLHAKDHADSNANPQTGASPN